MIILSFKRVFNSDKVINAKIFYRLTCHDKNAFKTIAQAKNVPLAITRKIEYEFQTKISNNLYEKAP